MASIPVARGWVRFLSQRAFDRVWFAAAAVSLGIAALLALFTFRTASSHFEALEKSQRTITGAVFSVYGAALDIETGERGFLVTGQAKYLEPYEQGATRLETACQQLILALAGGPEAAAADELHALATLRLTLAQRAIALPRASDSGDAARLVLEDQGKATMDRFRAGLTRIRNARLAALSQLQAAAEASLWQTQAAFFSSFALGSALLTVGVFVLLTRTQLLARTQRVLRAMNARLERRVIERTQALATKTVILEHSNADLEQFASVASHDLQEPLRVVAGCAQLLRRNYQGKLDRRGEELIQMVVKGSSRMKGLIDGVLAYSGAGKGDRLETVDARSALQQALAHLAPAIRESHAEITGENLPSVRFDPAQFEQVLQHLLGNAIKFRGAVAPQIHVRAERQGEGWRFQVADNGIGFDPQFAEKIFGVFQRLHPRECYGGTGIGLALVRRIVERRGGKVSAQSVPAQGATFTFSVPDQEPMGRFYPPTRTASVLSQEGR